VFHALKESFNKMTHLRILNSTCKKVLKINTSNFAVNACLYQIENEQQRLIAYQFKKLLKSEKKYEIHNKELLVIVKAL